MSVPSGFVPWCHAHGLSAWHPDTWPADGHAAFHAWRRDHVAARHARRVADGTWAILTPERRAELLQADALEADLPAPSRPFKSCPCHAFTPGGAAATPSLPEDAISGAEVAVWAQRDFWRAGLHPRTQACLAWLEETYGQRVAGIAASTRPPVIRRHHRSE